MSLAAILIVRHGQTPQNLFFGNHLNSLTIYSLLILCGICIYAAITHVNISLRQYASKTHLYFAGLCLAVILAVPFLILAYEAQTVTAYIPSLRGTLAFSIIALAILPWVITSFTKTPARAFVVGLTIVWGILFLINLFAQNTIQYHDITSLKFLHLPWGETISLPVGHASFAMFVGILIVLVDFGFVISLLVMSWTRERNRLTLAMLLAIGVFLVSIIESLAVRIGLINFVYLSWFGFMAMIVIMSMVISRDTQKQLRDSERRFRLLVEQSPLSIQVLSPDGHTRQVNPAWQQLWGIKLDKLQGYNVLEDQQLIKKGVMPYIVQGFAGTAVEIPPIIYNPADNTQVSGSQRNQWIRSYIYPIKDEAGSIRDVILMHEDVTAKKRVEDAIRLIAAGVSSVVGEQFFQQLVLNLAKVFEADYAFIALQDKHEWTKLNMLAVCSKGEISHELNFSLACVPFMRILKEGTCVYPQDVQTLFPEECLLTDTGVQALIGTSLQTNDGQSGLLVVMHTKPIEYVEQAKEILDIFAVRAGVELQRQQAEAHIRQLAYHDYLTGLANRAQLHEHLTQVIQRSRQTHGQGALILIDLDHFKTINDALGHDVGDELLRAVAKRIAEACSDGMFLARLGGDEFVAVMEMSENSNAIRFQQDVMEHAQAILAHLARPIFAGERAFTIGASIGIVCFPDDSHTELDILRHADMALYQAKSRGRNNIQLFLPDLEVAATNRLHMEAGLRTALEHKELELYYQPLVDAQGGAIAAEVLLRWHHPELGEIPPDTFIPVAEDTGLIHGIGDWVFEQACANLKRWQDEGIPFGGHLSINVCPWQFARPDFVADLREILQKHDIDARHLMLELTETALLYDLEETIEKLKALRLLGLRIALDDFGTGYSSLAYLRDLPLDQLKIDKVFVNEVTSTVEHPLVGSMIAIGKHMKLTVVAEGVETQTQYDKLNSLGCEYFQGFMFCSPLSEQAFLAWLANHATCATPQTEPS